MRFRHFAPGLNQVPDPGHVLRCPSQARNYPPAFRRNRCTFATFGLSIVSSVGICAMPLLSPCQSTEHGPLEPFSDPPRQMVTPRTMPAPGPKASGSAQIWLFGASKPTLSWSAPSRLIGSEVAFARLQPSLAACAVPKLAYGL